MGLFVDPQKVDPTPNGIVVLADPKSVIVLSPFISDKMGCGLVDETTGIPLDIQADDPSDVRQRWFRRIMVHAAVRPLIRAIGSHEDERLVVGHVQRSDIPIYSLGVAYTEQRFTTSVIV